MATFSFQLQVFLKRAECTSFVTRDRRLFICGENLLKFPETSSNIQEIKLPNNEIPFFLTSGKQNLICLVENNLCYAWGRNNCGQLGLKDDQIGYATKNNYVYSPNLLNFNFNLF